MARARVGAGQGQVPVLPLHTQSVSSIFDVALVPRPSPSPRPLLQTGPGHLGRPGLA